MEEKSHEYFEGGVELVWQVFPRFEKVNILKSIAEVIVASAESLCRADPVLPKFEISLLPAFSENVEPAWI